MAILEALLASALRVVKHYVISSVEYQVREMKSFLYNLIMGSTVMAYRL